MRSALRRAALLRRCRDVLACASVCLLIATACSDSEPEPAEAGSEPVAYHEGRARDGARTPLDASETPDTAPLDAAPLDAAETVDAEPLDASGTGIQGTPRIAPVTRTRVAGIDPFSHPTMPLKEWERFVAAVETLDRDAECPPAAIPDSFDDHVEVFRISDSCMHIEYHPLNGRTIWQARHEIKQADPTVFAVGFPSDDLVPDQTTDLDYDDYDQWHLESLQVAELQAGWPASPDNPSRDNQIVVAVIDSGVHGNHRHLKGRLVGDDSSCHHQPHNYHDDNEELVLDDNEEPVERTHGTHVAGIIAAKDIPGSGVIGIAPLAWIRSLKVEFSRDENTEVCPTDTPTLAHALGSVLRSEADIVNMSLRWSRQKFADSDLDYQSGLEWCRAIGPSNCGTSLQKALATMANCVAGSEPNDTCEEEQKREAHEHLEKMEQDATDLVLSALRMNDVVLITAAGNCGDKKKETRKINDKDVTKEGWKWERCSDHNARYSPAKYPSTIAVAALDKANNRWKSSTANVDVDIAAPGKEIRSTVKPDNVGNKSGTSMAAPMIAGVVAHMKARFPQASVADIRTALTKTAVEGPTGTNSNCEAAQFIDEKNKNNDKNDEKKRQKLCYGEGIVKPLKAIIGLAGLHPSIVYISDESGSNQIARLDSDGEKHVVTASSGIKWGPSLSPDGTQVVFSREESGQSDLWLVDIDGDDQRRLTDTTASEYAPSWSPDGSEIVYVRHESRIKSRRCGFLWLQTCTQYVETPTEIWVMSFESRIKSRRCGFLWLRTCKEHERDPKRLYSGNDIFNLTPTWTTDGTAILFDRNGDIASLDRSSGSVQTLLSDGHNYCPSSSPDSSLIAYSSTRPGNEEIYVMNADGTNRRRITDDPANDRCPEWMPDSKSLVFTSDRDGDEDIYIVDVDGTNLRQLTHNDHRDFQPSVTKSGEAAAIIASADLTVQLIDPLPAAVDAAGGDFAALSSSWDHVCSSLESRSALCWGTSAGGSESAPAAALTDASAGGAHSCALDSGGAVVCWGGGFLGQTDAPEGYFTAVAAGWDHTCGLSSSGGIECWGSDQHGQASPPSGRFTAVTAGDGHSCALDGSGTITCWGLNDDGQASPPSGRFTAIDTGSAHSCALDEAGMITCWGANWFGQADTPEGSFVEVAAGYGHTCALDEGGLAFCWGLNNDFQANAPYRVFTTITAGRAHACGLDIHAEVMCWGTIEPHDE